ADRTSQVEHRHGPAAHVGGTGKRGGKLRQGEQRRPRDDLLHLEHVHAKKLTRAQSEQQQRQPVVAGQAGTLVDAVQQVTAHGEVVGRGWWFLSGCSGRRTERAGAPGRGTRLACVPPYPFPESTVRQLFLPLLVLPVLAVSLLVPALYSGPVSAAEPVTPPAAIRAAAIAAVEIGRAYV